MKRFYQSIIVIFLIAFTSALSQPKLNVSTGDVHDFGKVKANVGKIKTTLTIKNTGNKTLEISKVKTSCGCTKGELKKDKLKPNESTTIDISINISPRPGPFSKTVTIYSNDPKSPNKIIRLKADIVTSMLVNPRNFAFKDMKVGYESVAKVKIKNTTKKDITLSDFEVTPKNMTINLKGKKVVKPGEEVTLIARVKPLKAAYFNCSVRMKTNDPDQKTLKVSGYGQVTEASIFNKK